MLDNYFLYWDDLPADSGYETFGTVHVIWLAGILAVILITSTLFRKADPAVQTRILRSLGIFILAMEAWRLTVLAATGHMTYGNLPLHLCGIAIFLEAACVFLPNRFLGEVVCTACLPGAAAALIFPDWLRYPTFNYMNLHGFLVHGTLVLIPVLLMVSGRYLPQLRRIWMPVLFLIILSPIIYCFNMRHSTNFMFLNHPSVGSPFETLYDTFGYVPYVTVFAVTVCGVILLTYGIIHIFQKLFLHRY